MTTLSALAPSVAPTPSRQRRWPIGAEALGPHSTWFRVWAPSSQRVDVVSEQTSRVLPLEPEGNGYFSGIAGVGLGTLYRFRLDDNETLYPDPASRFQPTGPFGPSEIIDPTAFPWTDRDWPGCPPQGRVIYEMHVGTFTPEGTWQAAIRQLPRLADLGINVLEVMPVADFPGQFGWGYDGVNLFAPYRVYGRPDDFRAFVDRAHALGVAVILDVVYNHVGPDGNFLRAFSPAYFSTKHNTEWGEALNFDGEGCEPVREFYLSNAAYWIDEYHLDGLRLDATQSIFDDSPDEHVIAGMARVTRQAGGDRSVLLIAENEPQHTRLVRSRDKDGYGLDMLWNDDFHHSARVALTGRAEAYYSDHRGTPQELLSAVKYGYLFQGQHYTWQKKGRGTPGLDLSPWAFVNFLDNHDQIANSGTGQRIHALTSPGRYRALTALFLLAPGTPMLFQGQEFASSSPFYYFADHNPQLADLVRDGRIEFLSQFPSLNDPSKRPTVPAPHESETFTRCKLNLAEIDANGWAVELHRDLLRLRRDDPTFSRQKRRSIDGAVLGPEVFLIRFFGEEPTLDRLLIVNLGNDWAAPIPEPLLAPPEGGGWHVAWSSENPRYGGGGVAALRLGEEGIPGHSALVLTA